ncbi:hypothetical protein C8R45DRAFT_931233 [Mycena sanguinolenta]|nr:hypothetical protein C8R45DRAFT_931233 [Mycena sanguinolenta]
MDTRCATSLPARFPLLPSRAIVRYPLAAQHGLTGIKSAMYTQIQAEVTNELVRLNPRPAGIPRDYEGHRFMPPVINTSKRGQPGMGMWAQICRGGHGSCRGEYVRLSDAMSDGELSASPWLCHLLAIRNELAPTPHRDRLRPDSTAQRTVRVQQQGQGSTVNGTASPRIALDVTVPVLVIGWSAIYHQDFETPDEIELFPRNDGGQLSLVLNDFLALLTRKGFDSDLELYRYNAWIRWSLDQPVSISRDNEVVLIRSRGVNYCEKWNRYFAML